MNQFSTNCSRNWNQESIISSSCASESYPYSDDSDVSDYSDSDNMDVVSGLPTVEQGDGDDTDLLVYRQSANFMLKLSEMIYNHALELSVQQSIVSFPPASSDPVNNYIWCCI